MNTMPLHHLAFRIQGALRRILNIQPKTSLLGLSMHFTCTEPLQTRRYRMQQGILQSINPNR